MNERDIEFARQSWEQRPGWQDGRVNIPMLANLIRADEREACAKLVERDDSMRWSGAANAIRARGNT